MPGRAITQVDGSICIALDSKIALGKEEVEHAQFDGTFETLHIAFSRSEIDVNGPAGRGNRANYLTAGVVDLGCQGSAQGKPFDANQLSATSGIERIRRWHL